MKRNLVIGILSRNAQRRMTLKNPVSITPNLSEQKRQGSLFTWVNFQRQFIRLPGQFSMTFNTGERRGVT